jgi:hypothetical protein
MKARQQRKVGTSNVQTKLIISLLLWMTYIISHLYFILRYRLTYENIQIIIIDLVEFTF